MLNTKYFLTRMRSVDCAIYPHKDILTFLSCIFRQFLNLLYSIAVFAVFAQYQKCLQIVRHQGHVCTYKHAYFVAIYRVYVCMCMVMV